MLRFALPLLLGYTFMIGMTFGNLGIIARQRAPMFPFLLMLMVGADQPEAVAVSRRRRANASGLESTGGATPIVT
jgi:hypothetical protein